MLDLTISTIEKLFASVMGRLGIFKKNRRLEAVSDQTKKIDEIVQRDEWTDQVGGFHSEGIGFDPLRQLCGECSNESCEFCEVWKRERLRAIELLEADKNKLAIFIMKKALGILLSAVMLTGMTGTAVMAKEVDGDSGNQNLYMESLVDLDIITKDMATGEITNETILATDDGKLSNSTIASVDLPESRMIIDGDQRYEVGAGDVNKYVKSLCYLEAYFSDGTTSYGTAFVVGDNVLVTAGHCLYKPEIKQYAEGVQVWPQRRNGDWPLIITLTKFTLLTIL